MNAPALRLELDADVTECGDVLAGVVGWDPVEPAPRAVVVRLAFSTAGSASPPDRGGPAEVRLDVSVDGRVGFEIPVPAAGPITFSGRTVSVSWVVEARLDVAGRDITASVPVTVLPAGGLAIWARQSAAPPVVMPDTGG